MYVEIIRKRPRDTKRIISDPTASVVSKVQLFSDARHLPDKA